MFHVKHSDKAWLPHYRELIQKYHQTLDLMSLQGLRQLDDKLADALVFAKTIEGLAKTNSPILDLGSGVGLPGIVIAASLPHRQVILAERRKKRCSFLRLVCSQLGLTNVSIAEGDVRALELARVAIITAQAVASLAQIYCLTRHIHARTVYILSRKGDDIEAELEHLSATIKQPCYPLQTQVLSSHGRLVLLQLPGGLACQSSV